MGDSDTQGSQPTYTSGGTVTSSVPRPQWVPPSPLPRPRILPVPVSSCLKSLMRSLPASETRSPVGNGDDPTPLGGRCGKTVTVAGWDGWDGPEPSPSQWASTQIPQRRLSPHRTPVSPPVDGPFRGPHRCERRDDRRTKSPRDPFRPPESISGSLVESHGAARARSVTGHTRSATQCPSPVPSDYRNCPSLPTETIYPEEGEEEEGTGEGKWEEGNRGVGDGRRRGEKGRGRRRITGGRGEGDRGQVWVSTQNVEHLPGTTGPVSPKDPVTEPRAPRTAQVRTPPCPPSDSRRTPDKTSVDTARQTPTSRGGRSTGTHTPRREDRNEGADGGRDRHETHGSTGPCRVGIGTPNLHRHVPTGVTAGHEDRTGGPVNSPGRT